MKKFFDYLKYLLKHKWYVFVECCKQNIIWRGITHDLSKFLPDEFIPYMYHFYGSNQEKDIWSKKFDLAWLKHQKRNKHHWQWWLLREDDGGWKKLPMDNNYRIEMICDWVGAGKAIKKTKGIESYQETAAWYEANKDKIIINQETRRLIEFDLKYLLARKL
jgi:hypothetical protein